MVRIVPRFRGWYYKCLVTERFLYLLHAFGITVTRRITTSVRFSLSLVNSNFSQSPRFRLIFTSSLHQECLTEIGIDGIYRSCTSCLQDSMSIFATAASNASQPASRNYLATAQLINLSCGPNFVNATIPPAKAGASSSIYHQLPPDRSLAAMSFLVMLFLFFVGDCF